uniref:Serine protease 33 n=1 Tax=Aceria tosichella TaxID=561515 RepID=A0A6G1S822_9ACAR
MMMIRTNNSRRPPQALILLAAISSLTLVLVANTITQTDAVIVDGKRSGPSALKNQSHEGDMIDGYNTKTCGISDPDKSKSDFVNSAREGQFPWLVSFQVVKSDQQLAHFCMGAFISDRWILSAAHCWADPHLKHFLDTGKVRVTAGSTNAYGAKNANFTIKRIFYHSKFDRSSPIGFDVSLVEVKEKAPIKTNYSGELPFINTVCLPIEGKEYSKGQAVKIAGWGDTESKDPKSKPDHLLTTDMVLTDSAKCAEIFGRKMKKVKNQYHNYKDFICADYEGKRDACQGDSGAPLLEYADNKAVAVGIVSYGLGCATKGTPGVYEKTSSLMPWIKDVTQNREKATVQFTLVSPPEKS